MICHLPFELDENKLTGKIPSGVYELNDLRHINLGKKQRNLFHLQSFSDDVLIFFFYSCFLVTAGNLLSATISKKIGDLRNLKIFDVRKYFDKLFLT